MAFSAVIGSLRAVLGLDSAAFEEGMGRAQKELGKFGRDMERLGRQIQDVGKTMTVALTVPILGAAAATVRAAATYEAAMSRVEGATQATAKQMDALHAKALQISQAGLGVTITEAANAMEALAKNGLDVDQILAGAAQKAAVLAKANNADLGPAADAVTDIMNNFGVAATDLDRVINGVTGTTVQSKFGFDDYKLALGQAGGVAGQLGVTLEDFNASLAATSSAFESGSDAGTSFKTFLQRLVPQSKEAAAMMEALGLRFYDAQGRMLPMAQIAQVLQDRLRGLNDEAKSGALTTIFGSDGIRTALLLAKAGADGIERYKRLIADTSAEKMAKTMTNGWQGAVKDLSAAILELQRAIAEAGLLAAMTDLVKSVTEWVRELAKASPETLKWGTLIAGVAAAIGPLVIAVGSAVRVVGAFGKLLALLWPLMLRVTSVIGPWGGLAAAILGAAYAGDALMAAFGRVDSAADDVKSATAQLFEATKKLREEVETATTKSDDYAASKRSEARALRDAAKASLEDAKAKLNAAKAQAAVDAQRHFDETGQPMVPGTTPASAAVDLWTAEVQILDAALANLDRTATTLGGADHGPQNWGNAPPSGGPGRALPDIPGRKKKEEFPDQFDAMMDDWREFRKMAAERLRDQNEATDRAEYELTLLGKSGDEQERLLALFDKRNELAKTYGDITNANAQAELKSFEQQLAAQEQLRNTNRTYQELENFGEQAFDRIGEAATQMAIQGKSAGIDFGNIWRGILSELMQEFIKLALLNPIKNALGIGQSGGKLETITSVIQGLGSIIGGLSGGGGAYGTGSYTGMEGNFVHRAQGGRVNPGQWYMTGEKGPEPFMPDSPGRIIPTKDIVANDNRGPTFHNSVTVSGNGVTEAQVRRALEENNRQLERNLNRSWGTRQSTFNALRA